jgi:hypothetical protein
MDKKQIFDLIFSFFKKKAVENVTKPVEPVKVRVEVRVDWTNPKSRISKYFTVEEAIMLREWKRLANEADGLNDHVKAQLIRVFLVMDIIRETLGKPVFIKSAYRPKAYNVAIGGATKSAHMCEEDYAAVDFWTDQDGDGDKDGKDCDDIKAILMPKLAEWGVRMEDNGQGARWVHIDNKPLPPGGNRFFKP